MKKTIICREPVQAHKALTEILWPLIKSWLLINSAPLEVNVRLLKRSSQQNRYFHKLMGEIAKSKMEWAGKPRNAAEWKVLVVSGHSVATKEAVDMIPGLENEFLNVREPTSLMNKSRASSLIEYATAFMVSHGIPVPAMEGDE